MYTIDSPNSAMMSSTLIATVDYKDAFFQDLRDHIEPLVRNSLFLYVAYENKAAEAAKYKADPQAAVPFLKRESELRGISVEALVELVELKRVAFKAATSEMELLRIEFNLRYALITTHQERLYLRDEFIAKIKEVMLPLADLQ